ncbi:carbamoyltransferase [Thermococcus argininiproducens]|uniref:Carbamoyltransferase n=1 Tax=Thermococcus argininiproducens TaxID=2866384 RepID=A0A9E7SBX0_9EURY|nr:carbamoyltransferase [Thermococcus argininiproducens]USG99289.1 carbamoyltransferase [Thermococcus argininiproducens]
MIILGIHDGHDAGAVLLKGNTIYAVNEERLNRIKKYRGFPELSIKKVIEMAHVHPNEIDAIAVAGLFRKHSRLLELERGLKSIFGGEFKKKVLFVEHHLAHAASAYYTSGWEESLALSIDAAGDGLSSSIYIGRNGEMIRIAQSTYLDSLGDFYASVTELLGFKPMRHEGKIMSLAAYGKPTYDLTNIIELNELSFENKLKVVGIEATKKLAEFFDYPFSRAREIAQQMKKGDLKGKIQRKAIEIAASAQAHLEKIIDELGLKLTTYNLKLAYAGGVAQNVKANAVLREYFPDLWVFPAMDDSGLAFGAAAFIKAQFERLDSKWKPFKLEHVYLGPRYNENEIEAFLKKNDINFEYQEDISELVAEMLVDGKIIGLFQGKMEYGPRALGNRSILADPRNREIVEKLNVALNRDVFQPFAPSILEEKIKEYLQNPYPNKFMTISYEATKKMKLEAPAVVHVDGTTRPQTLMKKDNPTYYNIIKHFEQETETGIVLNTSFNMHGEPIVCSPNDALRTFFKAKLDVLILENFVVYR